MTAPKAPVLFDVTTPDPSDLPPATPATAPLIDSAPMGESALQTGAKFVARPPSKLARFFWSSLAALLTFGLSLWAWDFATGLLARNQILGWVALGLLTLFCLSLLFIMLKELAGISRLRRIDTLRRSVDEAQGSGSLKEAQSVSRNLLSLYRSRDELALGKERLTSRQSEVFDAEGLLHLTERSLIEPLDNMALKEIEAASRQVAATTALVPLALADVVVALTANVRMIRRVAEVYGGRAGTLGSWRLTKSVLTHLVATGAVAIGDDMIGSFAGGGILSKLSRRFGEGLVNGALTARVGLAAMDVCRPMPFDALKRPSVSGVVKRSLTGLFTS